MASGERESREGWEESTGRKAAEREPIQSDVQATLRLQSRHIFFLLKFHPVCRHAAPFNHRHYDSKHLTNSRLLDLPPGRCLLQVAAGARRQTQEGGHPSLRDSPSIWTEGMPGCYCYFIYFILFCLGPVCKNSSACSAFCGAFALEKFWTSSFC